MKMMNYSSREFVVAENLLVAESIGTKAKENLIHLSPKEKNDDILFFKKVNKYKK